MRQANVRIPLCGLSCAATLGAFLLLSGAAGASADEPPSGWGFNANLSTGFARGDMGESLEHPISGEFNFFRQKGAWRFGAGVAYGSFKMKEPWESEPEFGVLQNYLFAQRMFRSEGSFRPYLQARAGIARLHPRSFKFAPVPLPEDLEPGESPTDPSNGWSFGLVPGAEFQLSRSALLDASVAWTYFNVDYDMTNVPPLTSFGAGNSWEGRLGVTWFPNAGEGGEGKRDAWGVRRSYGWAIGEAMAINFVASITTEYIRGVNFAQISPRSWWKNIEDGFSYDDNEFKTNQYVHPFNGAAYYNSARANGVSFWPSAGIAAFGAFQWECCGETHPMSFNDIISTGIGGIALGEAQYRLSSEILNNQSRGRGRFWREFGAFLVDPVRGFNRLLSGQAKASAPNPTDPMDWRPKGGSTLVATGFRSIGEGSSITNNTQSYYTILLNHSYGSVFDNTRRKPFDYMDFVGEINFGEKVGLGNVQIHGDLASWPLGSSKEHPDHVVSIVQRFDYLNNNAYEYGGQSVGASLSSRFRLSDKSALVTRVDAQGIILAGINADYSWLAEVEEQERVREYDYGPGFSTAASATLVRNGKPLLAALYRFSWIDVQNGSVYNEGSIGSTADHYIQIAGLRLVVPIKGNLGIGTDAYVFLRQSDYVLKNDETGRVEQREDVTQRNPQVRVYLSLSNTR